MPCPSDKRHKVRVFDLRSDNIDKLCYYTGGCDCSRLLSSTDVNFIYAQFVSCISQLIDFCIPSRIVTLGHNYDPGPARHQESGQGASVTPSAARRPGSDVGTATTPGLARRQESGPGATVTPSAARRPGSDNRQGSTQATGVMPQGACADTNTSKSSLSSTKVLFFVVRR